jgi:hypothetical protein
MAPFSQGNDFMDSQNVGTTVAAGTAASVPKKVYFGISPSTRRFHRLMATARRFGLSWQDIIRIAIDEYLAKIPQKV